MSRDGIVRCLLAAVLFGAAVPAASRLTDALPSLTLAGLVYLGAAVAVLPSVVRQPSVRRAIEQEWRPVLVAVIAGGAIGPVLLMAGLSRTSAATGSILLNTELAATAVVAAVFFREQLGRRTLMSVVLITIAGVLLTWQPGAALDVGALLIVAACVAWGLDNCVTAGIEQFTPAQVVAAKGLIAGGCTLTVGLAVAGWGSATAADVAAALVIGAFGYGVSTVLWVQGAQQLGAARAQVVFATGPFIGVVIAWVVLAETVTRVQVLAMSIAIVGVAVAMRSAHEHVHRHGEIVHDHEHIHDDDHHDHAHHPDDGAPRLVRGRHRHRHGHGYRVHAHPHVPDLHHRHDH